MIAEKMMVTNIRFAKKDQLIEDVFTQMRAEQLRMLPVVDNEHHVVGVVSTFDILEHIVPDYVASGDLKQISYAPDMGILKRNFITVRTQTVAEVMNPSPLLVRPEDALLSVAADLCSHGRHEYALVVDKEKKLLGIVSAGDILGRLKQKELEGALEANHA
ncbi:MAG: CBS domain-containing protein [Zetaproteobacteria bacterium CG2_30_46_52]|nr:MAG: CBS domain-containing protein [Zetaproteobacteria bacterium CG2_30_46_52]